MLMGKEANSGSSNGLPFSDKSLVKRFEGSPFKDNFIPLPQQHRIELTKTERFYSLCSIYRPGYVSATLMLYGVFQHDLNLVGAAICGLMAEASAASISVSYLNLSEPA